MRIEKGNIGIVTKYGEYKRIIKDGYSMLYLNEKVRVYSAYEIYKAEKDFKLMMKNKEIQLSIEILEIKDAEIAVVFPWPASPATARLSPFSSCSKTLMAL